jgi:formylglycine-generating enzyme required for sulfatase activity
MKTTKTAMVLILAVGLAFGALADGAMEISEVTVRQRWPWSRLVDIQYTLDAADGERADVAVSTFDGDTPLAIPEASLSGDLYGVTRGFRRIVWDPMQTAYTNQALMRFRVDLQPSQVPLYLIVDLTQAGQTECVYPGDPRLETYGRFTNVWFGVTNDAVYATDKLVLRRIPTGGYTSTQGAVTLTEDFYCGIFEVTQRQWERIMGTKPAYYKHPDFYMTRPIENITFNQTRGATNDTPSVDWPTTGRVVAPASFLGKLRTATGGLLFDLPTEAQWEYAYRAGTTTIYYDGNPAANLNGANNTSNEWMDAIGRYLYNGGSLDANCGPTNGTATVGSYQPNNWGLYDMAGNVQERVLDWMAAPFAAGIDPVGPVSSPSGVRVQKGGGAYDPANAGIFSFRNSSPVNTPNGRQGFRVILVLP